jgi:hypothetical protein
MYTTALSKIKDTIHAKYNIYQKNGEKRDTELDGGDDDTVKIETINEATSLTNKSQQYNKLIKNSRPGDLVFFVGGDKTDENGVPKDASIFDKMLE